MASAFELRRSLPLVASCRGMGTTLDVAVGMGLIRKAGKDEEKNGARKVGGIPWNMTLEVGKLKSRS